MWLNSPLKGIRVSSRGMPFVLVSVAALAIGQMSGCTATGPVRVTLAEEGKTSFEIAIAFSASETEAYAASELARYLERMNGAAFPVVRGEAGDSVIVLQTKELASGEETYEIAVEGTQIVLTGGSSRALVYAVYDFLDRLGCRWLAPGLDFYHGESEFVPKTATLVYEGDARVIEQPVFSFRKIYVEEGLTHDAASLKRIVEWMPKLRYNTLVVPINYGGTDRVRWDAWREELTPELDKRGILIEVGGHGYQNYLNPEMEGGTLFERHPDWFGLDQDCRPSRNVRHVFNTENPDAVAYLIDNVIDYVKDRPEIDIFDFWPPDGARWAECPDQEALGTPADRQVRLLNQVQAVLREARPDLRLEIIAYAHAKEPPVNEKLDEDVLVDFCPIGQHFDAQIYDTSRLNNAIYVDLIKKWRETFAGQISLYSYYRKYAWRSLPVIIPHYMQRDLQWYASIPLQGISTYAEPGDWGTYELNHYVLGYLAWNPDTDVDARVSRFVQARFGEAAPQAHAALTGLEDLVRVYGSVPYTELKSAGEIAGARDSMAALTAALRDAVTDEARADALNRLQLMCEFATRDLEIQLLRASGAATTEVQRHVESLSNFLNEYRERGVFLIRGKDPLDRYLKHYGLR